MDKTNLFMKCAVKSSFYTYQLKFKDNVFVTVKIGTFTHEDDNYISNHDRNMKIIGFQMMR